MRKIIFFAWIALAGLTMACEGEKGDVGPAGPKGDKGDAGAKGDTGVAGKDALGARVVTTGAVKSDAGGYTFGISNITKEDSTFLSTCGVLVYIKSQNWWWNIPGKVDFGNGKTGTFEFKQSLRTKTFFVDIRPVSWSEDQQTAPARDFEAIRIVLVPTEKFRRSSAEINWSNYDEVVKALGIKESDIIQSDL